MHIPVGYLYCIGNPRTDWMMRTVEEPGLNGRSLVYPRGKVLGGCSSVNGMIYMRGQAADYDHWRQIGNIGWGWDDVLPYFLKSEDNFRGTTPMHGAGGEWKVSRQRLSWNILHAVQEGAQEFGIMPREDFNDGNNEGSGFFEVNQRRGVRWNTAKGFLRPAMKRDNLRVVTHAMTEAIRFDGRRAVGVTYRHEGRRVEANAKAEVILAAGAINTPKLLEHSGVGQPERLQALGIDVHHALPGVGENLQDHLQLRTVFKVKNTATLNTRANNIFGKAGIALQYLLTQSGPMSMAPSQFGMFTKSDPSKATPDLEYHVQPLSTDRLGDPLHPFPAITVSVCNLRPDSIGSCHVASTDIEEQPEIRLNYLSTATDRAVATASLRQGAHDHVGKGPSPVRTRGNSARARTLQRRRTGGAGRQYRNHHLSPRRHLQDGRRSHVRRGYRPQCPRDGRPQSGRRVDHAADSVRQHRITGRHDRRKGGGYDSRTRGGKDSLKTHQRDVFALGQLVDRAHEALIVLRLELLGKNANSAPGPARGRSP